MATNNVINLKSSGIVSYDAAGAFTALANPLTVANGGQGNASLTAYAVLCGGTTTTNPVQSIAGVGTTGQVLTSNGAGALPTFQTVSANGPVINFNCSSIASPADSSTYYIPVGGAALTAFTTSQNVATRFYVPYTGTLNTFYGKFRITGTLASSQNVTMRIIKNNTTNADITTTLKLTANPTNFNSTSIGLSVTTGDYIELVMITPVWTTNPTAVTFCGTAYIS